MGFNKYFEKIFCINLEKRKDRWDSFTDEMKVMSIDNIKRFEGVDGNLIYNPTKMLNGEFGILLTHLNLIKKCKKNNFSDVLIFEDDLLLNNNYKNLDFYMTQVPDDWDFIYFGGNHKYGSTPKKISDNIIKLNHTVALHCVAIRNTMFDLIIERLSTFSKQVDSIYADLQINNNSYGIIPNMALQREDFSDIQNRIVNYNHFFQD